MARFRCRNCNYSFSPKVKGRIPEKCPYCSNDGTLLQEKSILDSIDVDDELSE